MLWWAVLYGRHTGYTLEVYPDEARRYRKYLSAALGRGAELLGEFDTAEEAEACVHAAVRAECERLDRAIGRRWGARAGNDNLGPVASTFESGQPEKAPRVDAILRILEMRQREETSCATNLP
jgi:hypothetical protein